MEKELHILILEDIPSDVELAQKELKKVLKNYMVKVVDTEKGFVQALATFKPDLTISDYQLPAFDGLSALQITREKSPFTPFIILTGSRNEDTAVECIKAGADDYVIKEHIKRLGPAVLKALENKKIELERKQAESELQIERDKLTAIFESMADGVYIVNKDYDIQYVNPVLKKTFGSPEGKKCHEYFHDSDEPCTFCKNEDVFAGKTVCWEWTFLKYGKTYDLIDTPMKNADGSISKLEIFRDITERKKAEERLKKTMDATIQTVSKIIEAKDLYTSGHQQRVSQLATAIAKELNLSQDKVEGIRVASLIHDIGKIGLPTEILSKPTKLTDIEFNLIKEHSQKGYDILKSIDFSYPIARIVLQHHERLNGSGYPNNLKGDEIILEAKIIGVADVVEAISSHRPYRPALGIDKALEEILQNRGTLYDPEVVNACLRLFKEKGFKFK